MGLWKILDHRQFYLPRPETFFFFSTPLCTECYYYLFFIFCFASLAPSNPLCIFKPLPLFFFFAFIFSPQSPSSAFLLPLSLSHTTLSVFSSVYARYIFSLYSVDSLTASSSPLHNFSSLSPCIPARLGCFLGAPRVASLYKTQSTQKLQFSFFFFS